MVKVESTSPVEHALMVGNEVIATTTDRALAEHVKEMLNFRDRAEDNVSKIGAYFSHPDMIEKYTLTTGIYKSFRSALNEILGGYIVESEEGRSLVWPDSTEKG